MNVKEQRLEKKNIVEGKFLVKNRLAEKQIVVLGKRGNCPTKWRVAGERDGRCLFLEYFSDGGGGNVNDLALKWGQAECGVTR